MHPYCLTLITHSLAYTHNLYNTPDHSTPLTSIGTSEGDPLVVTGEVVLFTEEFVKRSYIFYRLPAAQVF